MAYEKARLKSRQALKDAMLRLMRNKPVSSITVIELCRLCGLNRSTFYAHYPTLEDLLRDVHRDLFIRMEEYLNMTPGASNIRDEALFTSFLVHICQEDERFTLFLRCDESNLFEQNMVSHFLALLCPGETDLKQRNSLLFHMVGAFTLLCEWIRLGFPCPAEELAAQIIALTRSAKSP